MIQYPYTIRNDQLFLWDSHERAMGKIPRKNCLKWKKKKKTCEDKKQYCEKDYRESQKQEQKMEHTKNERHRQKSNDIVNKIKTEIIRTGMEHGT